MEVRFDDSGLVPCIAQDWRTGEVLTLAYMNEEALARTRESGDVWFFSRSRDELWHKGETSGNFLRVKSLRYDCDLDAVLALVEPEGPACHTGERTCFHNGDAEVVAPHEALPTLERTVEARRTAAPEAQLHRRAPGRPAADRREGPGGGRGGGARRRRTRATTASPTRPPTCSTTWPCCSPRAGSPSATRSRRSMAVAADTANLEISPSRDEVRELARDHTLVPLRHTFIDDCETPVSAYLKLRGAGPSFLLESAEQGQRFGRWSFLGVQPRSVIRLADGVMTVDGAAARVRRSRTARSARSSRATSSPSCRTCRRSPAARSGCSATTSSAGSSRRWASRTPTTSGYRTSR